MTRFIISHTKQLLIRAFNKMYGSKEAIDKLVFDYIQKQKGNNG